MIHIYTDGACSGNPGPGGWAAIVVDHDRRDGEGKRRLSGAEPQTTNNRMEMMAAIRGLESVPVGAAVTVHSDSQYVVNTMTKGWKRNANQDLWARLDELAAGRKVSWQWMRGHNGHPLNEEADRLAVAAMLEASGKGPVPRGAAPQPDAHADRLTHLDAEGRAHMVDVSDKPQTARTAVAEGSITMQPATLELILAGRVEKGDVFTVARLAGINAAKHTWELIPLAHQIPLGQVTVDFATDREASRVDITASAKTTAQTGVEMEALTAVSAAALTIYDMCKAVDRGMVIGGIRLLEKRGGVHGDYARG